MINKNILSGFIKNYSHINPIIICKTADKVKTPVELFDILQDFTNEYPVVWSSTDKKWMTTDDLTQIDTFDTTLGDI